MVGIEVEEGGLKVKGCKGMDNYRKSIHESISPFKTLLAEMSYLAHDSLALARFRTRSHIACK